MKSVNILIILIVLLMFGCGSSNPKDERPYSPSTTFQYKLPRHELVTITVHDTTGKKLMTLLNSEEDSGVHFLIPNLSTLQTGIYYFKLECPDTSYIKKFLLMK